MTDAWRFPLDAARSSLPGDPDALRFHYALRHGTMKCGLYAPRDADPQGPHRQDELYIVVSGTGDIVKNGERLRFSPHDVLFVEAGAVHRFENFSQDFQTWVVFWGSDGGE